MYRLVSKLLVAPALAFAGCATHPDDIQGYYVSPRKYQNLSCDDLGLEAQALNQKIAALYGDTKTDAYTDTALMTATIIVFWPAAFFIGADAGKESQYALLKGEFEAIQITSKNNDCDIKFVEEEKNDES